MSDINSAIIRYNQKVLAHMEPFFEKAEKEHLWFFYDIENRWFSPKELKELQAEGKYIWNEYIKNQKFKIYWELRDLLYKLKELCQNLEEAQKEYQEFRNKLKEVL